jgi:uncharacterized protein DUF6445
MTLQIHPGFQVQKLRLGREQAPLIVIDNLVANADELVEQAAQKVFADVPGYFPGIRAKAPLTFQQFVIEKLRDLLGEYFGVNATKLHFTNCHFSLVTTPGANLALLQRIPHIDSIFSNELACMYYLFKSDLGGTAFYRHRSTGFEYVTFERNAEYFNRLATEMEGPHSPSAGYHNADTPLFEKIGSQEARFNRLLVYRRNSLHSSDLPKGFVPDANPRTGRLSINGFLK